jgi:hypothetical protein
MSELGHNRLAELAGLIKSAHSDALQAAKRTADRALEAGHLLLEAKVSVGHGRWSGWLQENIGFSERTAQRYMRLAKSGLKSATVADLGIRAADSFLAVIDDESPLDKESIDATTLVELGLPLELHDDARAAFGFARFWQVAEKIAPGRFETELRRR